MKRASRRQQPEMDTLWFTKGMAAAPPSPPSLAPLGERATVAPRGRLKLIPKGVVGFPPRSASRNEEMEKRSRQRVRDQVALMAFGAESRMRSRRARISMMARNTNVPFKGRIQKRKTNHLQILLSACNARPVHTEGRRAARVSASS